MQRTHRIGRFWQNGPLLLIIATFFFTGMGACVKAAAAANIPLFQIVFVRSIVSALILGVLLPCRRIPYRGKNQMMLISRALAGSLAIGCNFYGLGQLPFGDATVLLLTFPVFLVILSFFVLGERPTPRLILLITIAWIGIILVLRPQFGVFNWAGLIMLLAAVFSAFDVMTIHIAKRTDPALRIAFYLTAGASVFSLPFMLMDYVMPTGSGWLYLIGAGLFGTVAQILISQAYGLGEISRLSPISYLSVVNSFALGVIIWHEIPAWLSLGGALIIVVCCTFIIRLEKAEPLAD